MGNNTTAITLYNEIANQIGANASNFLTQGAVTKEDLDGQLDLIASRLAQLNVSTDKAAINLSKNVQDARNKTNAVGESSSEKRNGTDNSNKNNDAVRGKM